MAFTKELLQAMEPSYRLGSLCSTKKYLCLIIHDNRSSELSIQM